MQVFIDTLVPSRFQRSWLYQMAAIAMASLLMVATSEIRFYLPFSPVPLSLHPFTVFLIGYTLGSRRALMAVLPYAIWKATLFEPSIGYSLAMVPAVYLIGRAAELGWNRSFTRIFASLLVAALMILAIGSLGLAFFIGLDNMLVTGFFPYLPGDLFKVLLASSIIRGTSHYLGRS